MSTNIYISWFKQPYMYIHIGDSESLDPTDVIWTNCPIKPNNGDMV